MIRLLILCLIIISPIKLSAAPIVADLAVRSVDIDHNFDGLDILLFGAQNDAGRIIIALKGPKKNYIVRKKEQIAGIWVNRKSVRFNDVNSLYALAATHEFQEIQNDNLLSNFELGLDKLNFTIAENQHLDDETIAEFRQALINAQLERGLYKAQITPISFWGESLFRTGLDFPKNIGKGWYGVEIYLFSDGILSSIQSTPVHVSKIGMAAYIFNSSHQYSFLYGIICVLMALSAGWIANKVLGRT